MNDTQAVEQSTTPAISIADMSLAEYRAQREAPAAAPPVTEKAEESAEGSPEPEESAAADTDTADDPQEHEGEEKPEGSEKSAKKRGGWQRKIEKAEREIESLKAQLAAKTASDAPKAAEPPPAAGSQFEPAKPRMDDFDSIEDFTEALTDWKLSKKEFERNIAEQQQRILRDWNSRQEAAQKTHADYEQVLNAASEVMLPAAHQRLFLESEAGAELAYQLAKDPAELQKFAAMDPLKAARYFGKLEAFHSSEAPDTATPRTSHAPRPIRPVGARSAGSAAPPDLAKLSLSDYRALRETGRLR